MSLVYSISYLAMANLWNGMEWNGIMSLDSSPLLLDGGHFLGYQKTSLVRGIKGTWI